MSEPDCGHPNHGAQDHDCRPFRDADIVVRARQALDAKSVFDEGEELVDPETAVLASLVDELATEVEKLRSDRDGWRAKWRDAVNHADAIAAEDAELRATLDRVRAEVQFLSARDQILIRAALDEEEQS